MFNIKQEVLNAQDRIKDYIRQTPLEFSKELSKMTEAKVYLKCENLQDTHSFKVRGAFSKLLSLTPQQRELGVITASSGNHGTAVAFGLNQLKIQGTVFVPKNVASVKVKNIQKYGTPLEYHGEEAGQTEEFAFYYAKEHHKTYVPPYNDPQVIGGQGTIGLELSQQLPAMDAVLVPVGGGGLVSGVAGYLKAVLPHVKIIGCLPENSPVMYESIKAGRILEADILPTISDATAGGIEHDAVTFEICQKLVDDYILVSEEEIKNAIKQVYKLHQLVIEGAPAVAIAALLKNKTQFKNKNTVIILSGANIDQQLFESIIQ